MLTRNALRCGAAGTIAAVVIASFALAVGEDFRDRFRSTHIRDIADTYARIDRDVLSATGGEGLFLRFVNIPPALNEMVINYYLRTAYDIYPQRVLAGEPSTPIFTADQLRSVRFDPDTAWLLRNHIRTEMTFTYDPSNGKVIVTAERIAPSQPMGAR